MSSRKSFVYLILTTLVVYSFLVLLPYPFSQLGKHPVFTFRNKINGGKIIFISDTQTPIWIEKLRLDENHNVYARNLLLETIIGENPAAVIHLGDMVAFGFSESDWRSIDKFLYQMKARNIPLFPTLGNHELLLFPYAGEKEFTERFPFYSRTGYSVSVGDVRIILLNSKMVFQSGL